MTTADDISISARARRLKEARKRAFPSAAAAAEALGINPVTVRAHENGQNGFPIETASAYAETFGVSLDWLLTGDGGAPAGDPVQKDYRPEATPLALHQLPNGKARLQINKVVPFDVALKVLALIEGVET